MLLKQYLRGLSDAHVETYCGAPLIQLVARRLVIVLASLRRCDNEPSAELRRALGNLVETEE